MRIFMMRLLSTGPVSQALFLLVQPLALAQGAAQALDVLHGPHP
jgi:hypothetical protein